MKNNQEFDRLAKQKMSEREFPFDEAHWQLASQQIARGKRNRFVHLFWLLIPVAAAWIWWVSVSSDQGDAQQLVLAPATEKASEQATQQRQPADALVPEKTIDENSGPEKKESASNEARSIEKKSDSPEVKTSGVKSNKASIASSSQANNVKEQKRLNEKLNLPDEINTAGADLLLANGSSNSQQKNESKQISLKEVGLESIKEIDHLRLESSEASGLENPADAEIKLAAGSSLFARPLLIPDMISSLPLHTLQAEEVELDNTRVSLPRFGPLFKFSVSGGMWNTQASFRAEKEEAWMKTSRSTLQESLGLEAIISGRHLGAGLGIHYTSYGEEVDASAVFNTYSETYKNWFLMAVDTTVLVITDSVWNGSQMTYTGYNEVRTIQVLESETGTITTQELVRDQRKMYNKVSYIELPLLLDAHIGSGPWTLGLRGGPTLAMQISRQGALPLPGDAGYFTFDEETTRRWMPGYQARFYIHYKLSPHWALGIEPGIRGLVGNSLTSSGLDRRSHALGGLFSLNYLWRKK